MYKKTLLNAINSVIGRVVKIDYNIGDGSRGQIARMALCVDFDELLKSKIRIDGLLQRVEYEALPNVVDTTMFKMCVRQKMLMMVPRRTTRERILLQYRGDESEESSVHGCS